MVINRSTLYQSIITSLLASGLPLPWFEITCTSEPFLLHLSWSETLDNSSPFFGVKKQLYSITPGLMPSPSCLIRRPKAPSPQQGRLISKLLSIFLHPLSPCLACMRPPLPGHVRTFRPWEPAPDPGPRGDSSHLSAFSNLPALFLHPQILVFPLIFLFFLVALLPLH